MTPLLEGTSILEQVNDRARRESLTGQRVSYLRESDIDRSGRGYYFPRFGFIAGFLKGEIAMDHPENWCVVIRQLKEIVLAPAKD